MNLPIFASIQPSSSEATPSDARSLYHTFEQVKDGRHARGIGAPLTLAALNGTALALMDWLHVSNMASQMRRVCAHPQQALALLIGAFQR
jgi:hypothetical protein